LTKELERQRFLAKFLQRLRETLMLSALTNCGPLARPLTTMRAKTGLVDRDRLLAAGVSPELSRWLKPVVRRDDDRRADTHR
jgi:hypothetical protein